MQTASKPMNMAPQATAAIGWQRRLQSSLLFILAGGFALVVCFPFLYMVSTSLKTLEEVFAVPMVIWPATPQWENYVRVWNLLPFGRFTLNSLIYTVSITFGEFTMGLAAGYAFARLRFPGKEALFYLILITF